MCELKVTKQTFFGKKKTKQNKKKKKKKTFSQELR